MSYGHEEEMRPVPVAKVKPSPYQPRKVFEEAAILELASSMRESTLLQPIVVRPKDGEYELIAGERRLRAAQHLGWLQIPAIVRAMGNQQAALLSAIENLQRKDLSPVEEADALQALMTTHKLTQVQLALKTGIPRSTIQSRLALLTLGPWLELLRAGEITVSQAVAVQRYKTKTEAEHTAVIEWMREHLGQQGQEKLAATAVDVFSRNLEWRFRELEYEQERANRATGSSEDQDDAWDQEQDDEAEDESPSRSRTAWEAKDRAQREEAEQKEAVRRAQLAEILRRIPAAWDATWWRAAIGWLMEDGFHYEAERQACLLLGLADPDELEPEEISGEDPPSPIVLHAATLPEAEFPRLLMTLLLAGDAFVSPWSREDGTPKRLVAAAQLLGVTLDELTPARSDPAPPATCVICGCTDLAACEGGCTWYSVTRRADGGDGVCSQCAPNPHAGVALHHQAALAEIHKGTTVGDAAERAIAAARAKRGIAAPAPEGTGTKWQRRNKRGSAKHAAAEA